MSQEINGEQRPPSGEDPFAPPTGDQRSAGSASFGPPGYGPPAGGAPPYGQVPGGPPPYGQVPGGPPPVKTNIMAILGLIFAFVFWPAGIVLSILGLNQTKKRNEGGRGLALAGLILSILFGLIAIIVIGALFAATQHVQQVGRSLPNTSIPSSSPQSGSADPQPGSAKTGRVGDAFSLTDRAGNKATISMQSASTDQPGQYDRPATRGRYVEVVVAATDQSGTISLNPFDFKIVGPDGTSYNPGYVSEPKVPRLDAKELSAGDKTRGSIVFNAPKTALTLQYAPLFGSVVARWQVPAG